MTVVYIVLVSAAHYAQLYAALSRYLMMELAEQALVVSRTTEVKKRIMTWFNCHSRLTVYGLQYISVSPPQVS